MTRRSWVTAGLLIGAALAARLAVLWRLPPPELSGDALNYTRMAAQLVQRHIYGYLGPTPDAYVTPGYPLFLAAMQWLSGGGGAASLAATRLTQAVLGALTLLPFYLLARDAAGARAAFWTGLMLTFYPAWVRAPAYLLTETLFTFAFGWYLWAQVRALRGAAEQTQPGRRDWRWPLTAGLLLGLSVLVRPVVVPLLALPWLYQFVIHRHEGAAAARQALRSFTLAAAGFSLAVLPWWVRNLVSLHHWVFLATQTGNPLLGGMDPYGLWNGSLWAGVGRDTGQQLSLAFSIFFWLLRHYPWLTVKWFTIGKFSQIFMSPWLGWDLPTLSQVHYPVVILGWLGALAALRRRRGAETFLGLVLFCLTVIQLAFIPESRYAYPLVGILAIFAGIALIRIFPGGEPDAPALAGRSSGL